MIKPHSKISTSNFKLSYPAALSFNIPFIITKQSYTKEEKNFTFIMNLYIKIITKPGEKKYTIRSPQFVQQLINEPLNEFRFA